MPTDLKRETKRAAHYAACAFAVWLLVAALFYGWERGLDAAVMASIASFVAFRIAFVAGVEVGQAEGRHEAREQIGGMLKEYRAR